MAQKQETYDAGHVPITEEFDSPKHTLPPAAPVIVAFIIAGALLGGYVYYARPKPFLSAAVVKMVTNPVHIEAGHSQGMGQAGEIEKSDQIVVLLHLNLKNIGEEPLVVRSIEATLTPDQGSPISDQPAVRADLNRLFQAYPKLAPERIEPLVTDEKIDRGADKTEMLVLSYPLSQDAFDKRKDFVVTILFQDKREPVTVKVPRPRVS